MASGVASRWRRGRPNGVGGLARTAACAAFMCAACSDPVQLGSDILWQARHEDGDLREWERDRRGGVVDGVADVGEEHARAGRFAARLVNPGDRIDAGPCLWRRFEGRARAFYSAWYLVPKAPTTRSGWTLQRFQTLVPTAGAGDGAGEGGNAGVALDADGGAGGEGPLTDGPEGEWRSVISLGMRSLPDGALALYVFDHSREHLRLPIAVPPPILPEGRWFHLEVLYEAAPEPEGRLAVWLDGRPVYTAVGRNLGDGSNVTFAVCNAGESGEEEPTEVFVDDVVVSRIRATPAGRLAP